VSVEDRVVEEPSRGALSPGAALVRDLATTYARSRPVRSVAVLGNRPMHPDPDRARDVDAADLVVRVNGFRVDERDAPPQERAYGRRADVVFFNRALRATPWFFQDYSDRLYLLVEPGRLHWEPESVPAWWPADLGHVHVSNDDLTLPLSAELGLPTDREGLWATTGTMAAWWARTTFPDAQLLLTGYSIVDDPHQTRWAHASGDECVVGAEHRIDAEAAMVLGWVREGRASIRR
jgi:hypothetical protein